MSTSKNRLKFNNDRDVTQIQYICSIIFGKSFLKLDTGNYGILYRDEFLGNLENESTIDFKKVDLKKIKLLATHWKNRFLEMGENVKAGLLDDALREMSNSKIPDDVTMIIIDDPNKGGTDDNFVILNSNTVYHQLRGRELEKIFSEKEKFLLRGYCRTIPVKKFNLIFNVNKKTKEYIAKYFEKGNKSSDEDIYSRFLELPIKESLNYDAANFYSLYYMLLETDQFMDDREKNTGYKIDIDNADRKRLLEDLIFLKTIKEDLYHNKEKLNEQLMELLVTYNAAYDTYVTTLRKKAEDLIKWKDSKNDPFYLIKVLQESGLYAYEFNELSDIFKKLKEENGDHLDGTSKKSAIELLKFLYESKEYKNRYKDRNEIMKLLQICEITEEDLSKIQDDESRKNPKGTFKNDIINSLQERQKKNISQMSVKDVRQVIDDYVDSKTESEPKFLNEYIERLRELNALDLATIIKLVNKGHMKNKDVIEFAINNDIDNETLNIFIYGNSKKTDIILRDFSNALSTSELSKLYKEKRQAKGKEEEKATKNFKKYAELFQTYKIDKDDKEIKKFLAEFKIYGKKDPKKPLDTKEIIYLYEIGLISGEYALKPNSNINILTIKSEKDKKAVEDVRYDIISAVIKDGKLKVEDAIDLFKKEIENLYSKSGTITKVMLDETLLGRIFKDCSSDQKFGIILACDFSDEISEKLILQYFSDTMESKNNNKKNKEDCKIIDDENKRKKKPYILISSIARAKQILSLDMPKPELTINNGILLVRSDRLHICILEQLYISSTEEQKIRTGEHPTYVMTTDYYDAHKNEFCKTRGIGKETNIIYNFSELSKLAIRDSENGNIKKVLHKLQENNPNREITTWKSALKNAVSQMCGKPIDYTENVSERNYQTLIGGEN